MGARSALQRLTQLPPRTGRKVGELGIIHNTADALGFTETALVAAGRLYVTRFTTEIDPDDGVTVGITPPPDESAVRLGIVTRSLTAEGGRWEIVPTEGGEFDGGEELTGYNFDRAAGDYPGQVLRDPTVTGGTDLPRILIFDTGGPRPQRAPTLDEAPSFVFNRVLDNYSVRFNNLNGEPQEAQIEIKFFTASVET